MADIISYCRLCISPNINRNFIPLNGNNTHYIEKFQLYFLIFLPPTKHHVLCQSCAQKLMEIEKIHKMAKNSNEFFECLPSGCANSSIDVKDEPLDYISLEPFPDATKQLYKDDPEQQSSKPKKIKFEPKDEPSTSFGHALNYDKDTKEDNSSSEEDEVEWNSKKNSFIRDGKRVFPCIVCKKEFTRGINRRNHYKVVHPELNRFKCTTCNETFQFKMGYKKHCKNMNHMICEVCKAHFKDFGQYKNHEKKCKKEAKNKTYACPHCYKEFDSENARSNHCKSVHAKR